MQRIHQAVSAQDCNSRRAQQKDHDRQRNGSKHQQAVSRTGDDKRDSGIISKAPGPARSHEILFRKVAEQASNAEGRRETRRRYHQPDPISREGAKPYCYDRGCEGETKEVAETCR